MAFSTWADWACLTSNWWELLKLVSREVASLSCSYDSESGLNVVASGWPVGTRLRAKD